MDKDKELAILKMVYDTAQFESVRHQESPDFVLQHHDLDTGFGVEITELYQSESHARLKNVSWYTDHLLDGGGYIHRKDEKNIQVDTISIIDADGSIKASDIMAVAHQLPSPSVYSELLASIVERKNDKIVEYSKGLNHVNLIVADMEEPFSYTDDKELYKYLFEPALRKIITSTKFNEVFLITRVKQDRKVFVPLRMLLVLGQIFLFDWASGEYYPNLTYKSPDARMRLFAEFLITIGHRITLRATEKGLAITAGRYLIRAIPGEGSTVLDYLDMALPNRIVPIEKNEHSDKLNEGFMTFYEGYLQKGTFSASVAFEVALESRGY